MVDQLCNPMPAVVSVAVNGTSYDFRLTQNASLIIEIDIKPGSSRNHVNPKSNGKIKVAILSSPVFNPVDVVSSSVRFGRTGIEVGGLPDKNHRDLNNDGVPDIVFRFSMAGGKTGIRCGDIAANLSGLTNTGNAITASDYVETTVGRGVCER